MVTSARTAKRLGADVTIVYRRSREDMPAIPDEIEQALDEGVKLVTMVAPLRVMTGQTGKITGLEVAKTIPGKYDARGRRAPVLTGDKYLVSCDTIIKAIGERPDGQLTKALGLATTPWGSLKVDPWTLQTSNPKVYAGGDYATGASNVATAMGAGKKAAKTIDRQLTGLDRFEELWPKFDYDHTIPPPSQGGPRNPAQLIPPGQRRGNVEVSPTFTEWQAKAECFRCLRCDIKIGGNEGKSH
jgi:NADH-quinone oxidoreductase subunit F